LVVIVDPPERAADDAVGHRDLVHTVARQELDRVTREIRNSASQASTSASRGDDGFGMKRRRKRWRQR